MGKHERGKCCCEHEEKHHAGQEGCECSHPGDRDAEGACGCHEEETCTCGCHTHHNHCTCGCHTHHSRCTCGCHGHHQPVCSCGCHHEGSPVFRRRFATREERIARLQEYLDALRQEAQAVEEHIAAIRAEG